MKILVINPNSDPHTDEVLKKKAELFAGDRMSVDVVHVTRAPKLVSGPYDVYLGADEMVNFVRNGTEYDAFVTACHSDPNLDLLRTVTDKPVVGICEASMKIASMLGNSFAVVSPSLHSYRGKKALALKYHCSDLFAGCQVSKSNDTEDVIEAARQAKERWNVDCIVLGCANYALADKEAEKELGIPVIDGLACALFLAAGLSEYSRCKR